MKNQTLNEIAPGLIVLATNRHFIKVPAEAAKDAEKLLGYVGRLMEGHALRGPEAEVGIYWDAGKPQE